MISSVATPPSLRIFQRSGGSSRTGAFLRTYAVPGHGAISGREQLLGYAQMQEVLASEGKCAGLVGLVAASCFV